MPEEAGIVPFFTAVMDPGYVIAALFLLGLGILFLLQHRQAFRVEGLVRRLSGLAERLEEALGALQQPPRAGEGGEAVQVMEEIRRRVVRLEELVKSIRDAPPAEALPPPPERRGVRAEVEGWLLSEGFHDVHLPEDLSEVKDEGEYRIPLEAHRDGVAFKGEIVVRDGRVVEERLRPSYEAFP